nr:hypothetical protein [Actinomadura madurae]
MNRSTKSCSQITTAEPASVTTWRRNSPRRAVFVPTHTAPSRLAPNHDATASMCVSCMLTTVCPALTPSAASPPAISCARRQTSAYE